MDNVNLVIIELHLVIAFKAVEIGKIGSAEISDRKNHIALLGEC